MPNGASSGQTLDCRHNIFGGFGHESAEIYTDIIMIPIMDDKINHKNHDVSSCGQKSFRPVNDAPSWEKSKINVAWELVLF